MIFSRVSQRAARFYQPLSKSARGSTLRTSWKRTGRRGYASAGEGEGHAAHQSSSEWPWAITSLVITVPSVYYLAQPQLKPKKSHGHDHHDSEHGDHGEHEEHEEKSEEHQESESSHEEEAKSEDQETSGENADEDSSADAKTAESEEGESADASEGEGKKRGGKGWKKESKYGIKQGIADSKEQDPDDKDLAASSKPAGNLGDSNTQSAKEEGLSNADTKHSTDAIAEGHSMKGEGIPETAKSKGTVDPFRPQK